jgi:uncharacterized membrane protein
MNGGQTFRENRRFLKRRSEMLSKLSALFVLLGNALACPVRAVAQTQQPPAAPDYWFMPWFMWNGGWSFWLVCPLMMVLMIVIMMFACRFMCGHDRPDDRM